MWDPIFIRLPKIGIFDNLRAPMHGKYEFPIHPQLEPT
jgi:hypothetical protein